MKCDLHSIIGILHEVESCETNDPIVYTNGTSHDGKTGNNNSRVIEFPKIYVNSLCIRDYGLADVRDLGNRAGVAIERITPKGSRFLIKALILEAIRQGKKNERELAKLLELPPDTINVYIKELDKEDFITAYDGYPSIEPGRKEYIGFILNPKGNTAFSDPSFLAEQSTINMSNTVNNNLQGSNIGNFANEVKDNARQQTNQYNYTIGQNIDEIERLILSLREAIQQFPEEQREDAEMEIDDLEAEIVDPEKQDPKRFGRRLKRLAVIGTTVAGLAGGALKLSENANTFTDNIIELGEKLEAPVEMIKDKL